MSRGTVNKVILLGRLGQDPEMRYAPSGTAIVNFSIATNTAQKNKEGNWEEKTEWHNIVAFGKTAEIVGEYVKKGKLVYIEGRLQTSSWEDQQGQKRYKTEILANEIQLIGPKGDSDTSNKEENTSAKKDEPPVKETSEEEDDLPF